MNAMIDGICYDTEKATYLGSGDSYTQSIDGVSIFSKETLYRGKNGRFFMVCEYIAERNFILRCLTGNWGEPPYLTPVSDNRAFGFCQRNGIVGFGIPETQEA